MISCIKCEKIQSEALNKIFIHSEYIGNTADSADLSGIEAQNGDMFTDMETGTIYYYEGETEAWVTPSAS